jgi:hypothetical protein
MLTLSGIEAYVRAECGELDGGNVDSEQIKRYVNFEQLKVQNELFQIGFKYFTKTAVNTGATFTEPTDLLQVPNSIINLRASAGTVRAFKTISYTGPTGNLTHTYKQPGTGGNSVSISCDGGTYATPSAGTISCLFVGGVFYLEFASGVMTASAIATLFNADPVYSQYFTCSTTTSSAVIVPSAGTAGLLASGAGTNYYPADEVSLEDFVRIESNAYKAPASTSPKYRRIGNANGKIIQVLPATTTYTEIEYYYRLADLSATTDTLKVPAEVEELVILGVMARIYEKTGNDAKKSQMVNEYEVKWKKYVEGFNSGRKNEVEEKQRMESADN